MFRAPFLIRGALEDRELPAVDAEARGLRATLAFVLLLLDHGLLRGLLLLNRAFLALRRGRRGFLLAAGRLGGGRRLLLGLRRRLLLLLLLLVIRGQRLGLGLCLRVPRGHGVNPLEERLEREPQLPELLRRGHLLPLRELRRLETGVLVKILGRDDHVAKVLLHEQTADAIALLRRVERQPTHDARGLGLRVLDFDGLAVLRVVDHHLLTVRRSLALQSALEFAHLAGFAVHQDDVRRREGIQKLLRLGIISVRTERYGVHGHAQRELLPRPARHRLAVAENLPGQRPLNRKVADDDAVLGVAAPRLEQVAGQTRLQHRRRGEYHARPDVVQAGRVRKVVDVVEHERVGLLERGFHVRVEHVYVRLIHRHRPLRERRRLVYGHPFQLRMLDPVVLQDQQHLLRAAQGDDRQEHLTPACQHPVDHVREPALSLLPRRVRRHAVGGLDDDDVRRNRREVRAG